MFNLILHRLIQNLLINKSSSGRFVLSKQGLSLIPRPCPVLCTRLQDYKSLHESQAHVHRYNICLHCGPFEPYQIWHDSLDPRKNNMVKSKYTITKIEQWNLTDICLAFWFWDLLCLQEASNCFLRSLECLRCSPMLLVFSSSTTGSFKVKE